MGERGAQAQLTGVELGIRAYHVHLAVLDALNAALLDTGLFFRAFAILDAFVAHGAETAGGAARVLGLGDSGAWDAATVLEQRGYITRAGAPGSWGRTVTVTDDGYAVHDDARRLAVAAEQDLIEQLGGDVLDVLRRLAQAARPPGWRGPTGFGTDG